MNESFNKERWEPGERAWFEYHCLESPESSDAEAWYRSHQEVEVLSGPGGELEASEGMTFEERGQEGVPHVYRVRFPDGLEWDAWEDELHTDKAGWYRPDPPKRTAAAGVA